MNGFHLFEITQPPSFAEVFYALDEKMVAKHGIVTVIARNLTDIHTVGPDMLRLGF